MKSRNTPSFIVPAKKSRNFSSSNNVSKDRRMSPADKVYEAKKELAKESNGKNNMRQAAELARILATPTEILAVRAALGVLENGVNSLANSANKMLPYFYSNTTSDVDNTKIHIIRFNVGRESTKSVKTAESINGSSKLQLSNSLSECQDVTSRSYLNKSFGFNQKSIDFLEPNFYVCVQDYSSLFNITGLNVPHYGTQVPYAMVKEEYSNVRIRNSNTYHKLKFKINIIKILDDDLSIESLHNIFINKSVTRQQSGAIPKIYQISDRVDPTNQFVNSALFYGGARLSLSPAFVNQARVVKTFSKTLNPGDTLDFRMRHHMGPGVRLDLAKAFISAGAKGKQPSAFGIIVEAEGTECQGMRIADKSIFQGSCPGWYNYEFSKGITLVKTPVKTEHSQWYLVKNYEREFLTNPPITFNAEQIGRPDEKDKDFTILSTSKQHVVFGSSISNSVGNSVESSKNKPLEIEGDFDQPYENEEESYSNE